MAKDDRNDDDGNKPSDDESNKHEEHDEELDAVPPASGPQKKPPPETTKPLPAILRAQPEERDAVRAKNMAASTGGPTILRRFALPSNYSEGLAGVKKKIAIVPVGKPKRTVWWHANPEHVLEAGILYDESATGKDAYLVDPGLVSGLGDDVVFTSLHGTITREGVYMVVPVRLPGTDGRLDAWNESMREAITASYEQPVRTASSRDAGFYMLHLAPTTIEMPPWPTETWDELLVIAFRGRMIDDLDHPVLRRLRGEV
jgi:hypothetical protein